MGQFKWFIGLDVHAKTIAGFALGAEGQEKPLGVFSADSAVLLRKLKALGSWEELAVCYEAGPTGFGLYRKLTEQGIHCLLAAPSMLPVKPGDRVKTDRRDARRLAVALRNGEVTPVWVPGPEVEALRDLVRTREAAKHDQTRARHRLGKFLLRHDRPVPARCKRWGTKHLRWIEGQKFDHRAQNLTLMELLQEVKHQGERLKHLEAMIAEALREAPARLQALVAGLQVLRGVRQLTALVLALESGDLTRFARPGLLMAYGGLVSSENSSGDRVRRGGITKTGNTHLRRAVVESSWSYRYRPAVRGHLARRQRDLSPELREIGWKAQIRLFLRYRALLKAGKPAAKAITAVARELLGFVWAVGQQVAQEQGEGR